MKTKSKKPTATRTGPRKRDGTFEDLRGPRTTDGKHKDNAKSTTKHKK